MRWGGGGGEWRLQRTLSTRITLSFFSFLSLSLSVSLSRARALSLLTSFWSGKCPSAQKGATPLFLDHSYLFPSDCTLLSFRNWLKSNFHRQAQLCRLKTETCRSLRQDGCPWPDRMCVSSSVLGTTPEVGLRPRGTLHNMCILLTQENCFARKISPSSG